MKKFRIYFTLLVFFYAAPCLSNPPLEHTMPISVTFMLNKAGQLAHDDKIEEAIMLLETFQKKAETAGSKTLKRKGYTHYYIDFVLGNYYLMLSQTQKAVVSYQIALEKKEDLSDAWINLAKCYYDLNQPEKAASSFLKGYETSTEKQAIHLYYSSVTYMMAKDEKKAYILFQRLLKAHPHKIELPWKESLVQILFSLEKYQEALPHIETLAQKSVGNKKKEWQEILLSQYMMMQMDEKALSYAEWLTQVDTLEPKWWKALCQIHLSKNKYEDGLVSLFIYSLLSPLTDEENKLMADLFMTLGIPVKATEYYHELLKRTHSTEIIKKLAQSYIRMHDLEAALNSVDKGLQEKKDMELLALKGNLLYETEKYRQAADVYQEILEKDKNDDKSLLMLGYALWNMGETNGARAAFIRIEENTKSFKSAKRALEALSKTPF